MRSESVDHSTAVVGIVVHEGCRSNTFAHRQVGILDTKVYDDICIITDEEAINTSRELTRKEGMMCGISSGTNVACAIKLAMKLGKGKTVVTVLPDTAERYFSTPLFEE